MPNFEQIYAERQRKAVVFAVLDSAKPVSGKRAAELAQRGELPSPYADLEPFAITARYVQELVMRERQTRAGVGKSLLAHSGDAKTAGRAVMARAFDVLDEDLKRVERMRAGADRARAVSAVIRSTRELLDLAERVEAPGKPPNARSGQESPTPTRSPAAAMAERIRAPNGSEPAEAGSHTGQ